MFDIATRPNPTKGTAAIGGVPFDWRLAPPLPLSDYPWHNYATHDGVPATTVESLATYALALEDTLQTAIYISLFSDRRAGVDDRLPAGVTDRRGWVGDEFVADDGDAWGSKLWLLYSGKATADVPERARFAVKEALAWMIDTGVASLIEAEALWVPGTLGERLAIRPQIYQPQQAAPVYDVLWGTTIARGASA